MSDFSIDFSSADFSVYSTPSVTGYKTIKRIYSLCPWTDSTPVPLTDCCFSPDLVAYNKTGVFLCDITSTTPSSSDCGNDCYITVDKAAINSFCDTMEMVVPFDCNNTYICTATCCVMFDDFNRADGTDLNLSNGIKEGTSTFIYIPAPMYEWSLIDGSTDDWAIDTNILKVTDSYAVLCLSEAYPWETDSPTDSLNTCPYISFKLFGLIEGDCARVYIGTLGGSFSPDYCIEFQVGGLELGKVRILFVDTDDTSLINEVIAECEVEDFNLATWHDIEILNGLIKINGINILNWGTMSQAWRNPGANLPPYLTLTQSAAFLGTGAVDSLGYIAFDDVSVRKLKRKYLYGSDPVEVNSTVAACDTCPECAWFDGVQPEEVTVEFSNILGILSFLNGSIALDLSYGNKPFDAAGFPVIGVDFSNTCVYYLDVPFTISELVGDWECFESSNPTDTYTAYIRLMIGWDGLFRIRITTDMDFKSPTIELTGYWAKAGTDYITTWGINPDYVLGESVGCLQDNSEVNITGWEAYSICDGLSISDQPNNETVTAKIYNLSWTPPLGPTIAEASQQLSLGNSFEFLVVNPEFLSIESFT